MSHYGKTIKQVENLINKARETPNKSFYIRRNGQDVYRAKYHMPSRTLRLSHYGTRILTYNRPEGKVISFDGYSASDRDALNTALDVMHHTACEWFQIKEGDLCLRRTPDLQKGEMHND